MATATEPPTTAEMKAAFNRAAMLHLGGWTFERAMATPLVRQVMETSALAHRRTHQLPAQPRLI